MRKISESAWGDMMRRGSGENIRTEDNVNLLDAEGLYDYIKSKYEKYVFYLDKTCYNEIYVDVLANISLILKPNSNYVLLSWSKEKISMPFFDKLSERFKVENPSVNRRIIKEKDGTCTNQTYIDVIDFFLDNIDNMLVTESAWGDMMRRGSGDTIRKEDDVNHMDFDTFSDYIKDNYSEKGNWFAIREDEDEKSRHIEIDIIYSGEIDLTFNVVKGEIYNILVHGNKNYVDIPGLKEIFNVNVLGSSTFSVYEKNWTISNNTFVKLIEFYLNKKTNESAWGNMMRRGSGEEIRAEDDPKNMNSEEFYEYLKNHYELVKENRYSRDIELYDDGDRIIVPIVETPKDKLEHKLNIYINYEKNSIFIFGEADKYKDILINGGVGLIQDGELYNIVLDKDKTINEMFLICLDLLIEGIEPEKRTIRKKVIMNESAWGDMMRRGSGENTRTEEKVDNLTWDEFYDYLIDRYKYKKESVNKIYKTNYSIDVPVFSGSHTTQLNITNRDTNRVSLFMHESDIRRGQDFENNLKLKYKIESQYIEKGWWSIYFKSKDDSFDMDLNSSFVELIDYILDMDKPFENIIEKAVNESAWGDMMRRGAGEEVREEDIDFLNSVKSDIRFFAIDIVYADLYKNSIDGFKEFMSKSYKNNFYDSKTHENVGKKMVKDIVIYVEANWNKGKNYESQVNEEINKEEEKVKKLGFVKEPGKSIEKTLNDWWDSYPYKDDLMNEVNQDLNGEEKYDDPDDMWNDSDYLTQIETYLKEKINESAWGDMMRRGSGEDNRIEDEILSDLEIKVANELTLMYCRNERAKYIQNRIVPPPSSYRKENDYEGLIKYIEARRDEKFYNDFDNYDKIIRYIKKNWDRLDMDKYIKKYIFSPDMMKDKKLLECEGVPGGATPANVGGMGAAYFPGLNGEPGSGDLPSPTGIVYHQVAPYTTFLKQIKKKKKKTKKFRKEDEPCVHSENPPIYSHVDDFRDYVDRTYTMMNRKK